MADSFNKKERAKKKQKRKQEKAERKKQRQLEGKDTEAFVYLDENGNFTSTPPDLSKKKEIKLDDINISTPKNSELKNESFEREGYMKFYNEEKRFGFIIEKETDQDYFVHEDNLIDNVKTKDKVVFEIGTGPRGLVAVNVKLLKK
ncbi:MAG: cold-shock protein [Flammeovirgaceae bacterium]